MEHGEQGKSPGEKVQMLANRLATDSEFRERFEEEAGRFNELVENSVLRQFDLEYGDRLALLSRKRTELDQRNFLQYLTTDTLVGRPSDNGY